MEKQLSLAAEEATSAYHTAVHLSCSGSFPEYRKKKLSGTGSEI
jgi:hypothetical protein